ncbi:MAG: hypothetical protein NVS9B15_20130 [Acidobacteriaceae bacterium]
MSKMLRDYVGGYNGVVVRAANRRFGKDVFKESSDEAERIWKDKNHEVDVTAPLQ